MTGAILAYLALAVSLALDASAAAVSVGAAWPGRRWGRAALVGLLFGTVQGLAPLAGFLLGRHLGVLFSRWGPWLAGGLLVLLGGRALLAPEPEDRGPGFWSLLALALATSVDALAVGLSMAVAGTDVRPAAVCIGLVTALLTGTGALCGERIGRLLGSYARWLGGGVLLALGLRLLYNG